MAMLQVGGCLGGRFQCLHSLYRILRDSEKNAKTKEDLEKDGIRMWRGNMLDCLYRKANNNNNNNNWKQYQENIL